MQIGVISDTHGWIREEALKALEGSDIIIHAGDICGQKIFKELEKIAPVYGVRGNMDKDSWGRSMPLSQTVEAGEKLIYVIHNIDMIDFDPKAGGVDIIIYGHSHSPTKEIRRGVLYFNPGSAGPKRFQLPVCLGRIKIDGENIETEWINLERP